MDSNLHDIVLLLRHENIIRLYVQKFLKTGHAIRILILLIYGWIWTIYKDGYTTKKWNIIDRSTAMRDYIHIIMISTYAYIKTMFLFDVYVYKFKT